MVIEPRWAGRSKRGRGGAASRRISKVAVGEERISRCPSGVRCCSSRPRSFRFFIYLYLFFSFSFSIFFLPFLPFLKILSPSLHLFPIVERDISLSLSFSLSIYLSLSVFPYLFLSPSALFFFLFFRSKGQGRQVRRMYRGEVVNVQS